ncbi:protein of unknown function (plasmid) [Pararobbsia alpina]
MPAPEVAGSFEADSQVFPNVRRTDTEPFVPPPSAAVERPCWPLGAKDLGLFDAVQIHTKFSSRGARGHQGLAPPFVELRVRRN